MCESYLGTNVDRTSICELRLVSLGGGAITKIVIHRRSPHVQIRFINYHSDKGFKELTIVNIMSVVSLQVIS